MNPPVFTTYSFDVSSILNKPKISSALKPEYIEKEIELWRNRAEYLSKDKSLLYDNQTFEFSQQCVEKNPKINAPPNESTDPFLFSNRLRKKN